MDDVEFDELYSRSFRLLCAQLYAMIGDREEARDCVQEAFVRAWDRRAQLDGDGRPEAWLRTTAYRLAVSRWRRFQRSRRPPDRAVALSVVEPPATVDHVAVVTALAQLPEPTRRAIVLHYVGDLSVAEVARELGVAEGTVKSRLSRGRDALAALLTDDLTSLADPIEGVSGA